MRRKFGKVLSELAKKDKKIILLVGILDMEYLMISEKIIQIDFLIWVFVNKV